MLSTVLQGFPGGSVGKASACNAGDMSLITGLGRSPGGGFDTVFFPGNPHRPRSLVGYNPQRHKESDMTESNEYSIAPC